MLIDAGLGIHIFLLHNGVHGIFARGQLWSIRTAQGGQSAEFGVQCVAFRVHDIVVLRFRCLDFNCMRFFVKLCAVGWIEDGALQEVAWSQYK
jgi:hypothetical protein